MRLNKIWNKNEIKENKIKNEIKKWNKNKKLK